MKSQIRLEFWFYALLGVKGLNTSITTSLTLLLVTQTGDHTVEPKERDNILMTPAESTVTDVPSSPNLQCKTSRIKMYTLNGNFCQVVFYISMQETTSFIIFVNLPGHPQFGTFFTWNKKLRHPLFLSKTQNYINVSQLNVHDQNFGITHHPNKFLTCQTKPHPHPPPPQKSAWNWAS